MPKTHKTGFKFLIKNLYGFSKTSIRVIFEIKLFKNRKKKLEKRYQAFQNLMPFHSFVFDDIIPTVDDYWPVARLLLRTGNAFHHIK